MSLRPKNIMTGEFLRDNARSLLLQQAEILVEKNRMYGNSAAQNGELGVFIRLTDKLKRLETLLDLKAEGKLDQASFESLEDVWRDVIGYATIGALINMFENNAGMNPPLQPAKPADWMENAVKNVNIEPDLAHVEINAMLSDEEELRRLKEALLNDRSSSVVPGGLTPRDIKLWSVPQSAIIDQGVIDPDRSIDFISINADLVRNVVIGDFLEIGLKRGHIVTHVSFTSDGSMAVIQFMRRR